MEDWRKKKIRAAECGRRARENCTIEARLDLDSHRWAGQDGTKQDRAAYRGLFIDETRYRLPGQGNGETL
jgi:hypothetical protein